MTRGTIVLIGPKVREVDLFMDRLERDGFYVSYFSAGKNLGTWLHKNRAQAVLFTAHCDRKIVERVTSKLKTNGKLRFTPALVVSDMGVPEWFTKISGLGEVLQLHKITLAQSVKRLGLAIQLSQLRKQYTT